VCGAPRGAVVDGLQSDIPHPFARTAIVIGGLAVLWGIAKLFEQRCLRFSGDGSLDLGLSRGMSGATHSLLSFSMPNTAIAAIIMSALIGGTALLTWGIRGNFVGLKDKPE
jgi:hypothetical protein